MARSPTALDLSAASLARTPPACFTANTNAFMTSSEGLASFTAGSQGYSLSAAPNRTGSVAGHQDRRAARRDGLGTGATRTVLLHGRRLVRRPGRLDRPLERRTAARPPMGRPTAGPCRSLVLAHAPVMPTTMRSDLPEP